MSASDDRTGGLDILLVEDNPGDARYIREMFRGTAELSARTRPRNADEATDEDPDIVHETRLADGLDRLDADRFDVVLLDLDLPDSEGLDTVAAVREEAESVPIVVLTGLRDRELGMTALRQGAEEYLVKDEIHADLLMRSVHHAIERKHHERELEQYRTLIETVSDGVYALDDAEEFVLVNEGLVSMTGHDRADLLGAPASLVASEDATEGAAELVREIADGEREAATVETDIRTADGRSIPVETSVAPFPLDGDRRGRAGVIRDIAERKERERTLERQRNQLATLNSLNELVHETSTIAIESSTRAALERRVCERIAAADPYQFAWTGDRSPQGETVDLRTEAGVEGFLDGTTVRLDGESPASRALRSGDVAVEQRIGDGDEEWAARARERGAHSAAAIPVTYEDTLYGVLAIYSERPDGFADDEREVIGRLGEVLGHAVNAIERKEALMSEEVVKLDFTVREALGELGVEEQSGGTITFDRTIPLSDEEFLQYGTVTDGAMETLQALCDGLAHYGDVTVFDPGEAESRFEVKLSEPPVVSTIASHGGRVERFVVEKGDFNFHVQLPPGADARAVVDVVQEEYGDAELIANRRTTRTEDEGARLDEVLSEELTEKQRTAIEAAFFAGFFEWPRDNSGEDVAESLGISAPTFHHHVRAGEQKLLHALLDGEPTE